MADEKQSAGAVPKFDARLAEGVAYFERMLEIMPEDRTTLEFLVVAYEQLGEPEKAKNTLVSLANLLIKEGDKAALAGLLPRLQACDSEAAKILALRVARLTAPEPDLTPELPKQLTDAEKAALMSKSAIASEVALVRQLEEEGVLASEVAGMVRQHLESSPSDGRLFLVSALQILEKENRPAADRALEHLADRCGTPPVPLAAFDIPADLIRSFPQDLVRIRGVVPFARLGGLTLAVTLNPLDEELRAAAAAVADCRFFLADASAVEAAVGRVYGETGGS